MALLPTDSKDYHILAEAAERTRDLPGLSIEIGLREGGGTSVIIEHSNPESTHIAVDPYGGLPFGASAGLYSNEMRDSSLPEIYKLARQRQVNFLFFNMEDIEFFHRFRGNVPVYLAGHKTLSGLYRLMHVDGLHTFSAASRAFEFFECRACDNAEIVFDDVDQYDHGSLHDNIVYMYGWFLSAESENRRVYRRTN